MNLPLQLVFLAQKVNAIVILQLSQAFPPISMLKRVLTAMKCAIVSHTMGGRCLLHPSHHKSPPTESILKAEDKYHWPPYTYLVQIRSLFS